MAVGRRYAYYLSDALAHLRIVLECLRSFSMTVFEMNYNTWYRKAAHGWDLPDTIKADADMIGWDPASGATLELVENDW